MELLLFDRPRFDLQYNCTFYEVDEIPLLDRQSILGGTLLIILCLIFEAFYIPCLVAMRRMLDQNCYKIMFAIGLTDLVALPMAGLIPGLFALRGIVFCSAPQKVFTVGMFVNWVWCLETSAAVLLAANRCAELLAPRVGAALFSGPRTWLWLLAAFAYSLFYGFVGTSPAIWSSREFTWTYNPHADYAPQMGPLYVNSLDTAHSIVISTAIPGFYAFFCVVLMAKRHKLIRLNSDTSSSEESGNSNHNNNTVQSSNPPLQKRMTRIIFLQVFVLCAMNTGVSFCYALMGFVSVPPIVVVICGTWLWLFLHGHPPFIYLLVNNTIRAEVRKMMPKWMYKSIHFHFKCVVGTTPTQQQNVVTLVDKQQQNGKQQQNRMPRRSMTSVVATAFPARPKRSIPFVEHAIH